MIDVKCVEIVLEGFPENEMEDIKRCLATLYSVREGEQPLDRDFGIGWGFLDKPVPVAENMLALEITGKTGKYEKRVTVSKVEFREGAEGQIMPVVFCKRRDTQWT